jgi:hypothetical protein
VLERATSSFGTAFPKERHGQSHNADLQGTCWQIHKNADASLDAARDYAASLRYVATS